MTRAWTQSGRSQRRSRIRCLIEWEPSDKEMKLKEKAKKGGKGLAVIYTDTGAHNFYSFVFLSRNVKTYYVERRWELAGGEKHR